MNELDLSVEKKVTIRFKCRDRQFHPIDFKRINVLEDGSSIILSQNDYAVKMTIEALSLEAIRKPERSRNRDATVKLTTMKSKSFDLIPESSHGYQLALLPSHHFKLVLLLRVKWLIPARYRHSSIPKIF